MFHGKREFYGSKLSITYETPKEIEGNILKEKLELG